MTTSPTVAVIVPVYNCEDYIEEALISLENQTRLPDEVVVVDDGSTDSTAELIARFQAQTHLRIIVVRQRNQGIAAARNSGVLNCSTTLVTFLDGDDAFYPSFIEKTVQALVNNPDFVACFSDRDVTDQNGTILRQDLDEPKFRALNSEKINKNVFSLVESPFITLVSGNVIPIGNFMLKAETFHKVGGFDNELRAVEDRPLLMRLAKMGSFCFIDEPLGIWRRHGSNTSGSSNAFKMSWYAELGLKKLESQAMELGLNPTELEAIQQQRRLMPTRLLYSAADSASGEYWGLATKYFKQRQVSLTPTIKYTVRYLIRRLSLRLAKS